MAENLLTAVGCAALVSGCFVEFGDLQPSLGGGCPPNDGVGEWHFDEGDGQLAHNALSSCYPITLGTSDASETTDPTWTIGGGRACTGAALAFDGVDDRAFVEVQPAAAFTFDFCVFAEVTQTDVYPRVVSAEEDIFSVGFFVNLNTPPPPDTSSSTLTASVPGTETRAETEVDYGFFATGERSCWRVSYDDAGDRMTHVLRAAGDHYEEITSFVKRSELAGELHISPRPMLFGNRDDGSRPLAGAIDEVRLFTGAPTTSPPLCDP